MKQLTQKLKDGTMQVQDVPEPMLGPGMVLVRNRFSLISGGTEGSTVAAARKSLLGKAKERPQQVKQALEVLIQQGPVQAYRAVMKKLDAWSPLGYSCTGEVIRVAPGVAEIAIGDLVACGGLAASHAEVVAVPGNLCVKLSHDADLKQAAYNTLGAIALQGVRQADLRLGEACAVIGLGLIGQLTGLLLKAGGVRVVGIDVDDRVVRIAAEHSADLAVRRDDAGIETIIDAFTGGLGVDAVIIAAGTDSLDPVNFAGRICRKKGRVVIVGNVPTGFDRDPHYYRKELELRMSCSYGPGRYDPDYEEKGIDYPAGYVRWTERRNMQAFQELIHSGRIDVGYLSTHEFSLAEAPQAYDMILGKKEPALGILIRYDADGEPAERRIIIHPTKPAGKVGIAFIGAGSYAQSHLLPNLKGLPETALHGVMTSSGTTARSVAERFGFAFCTSDEGEIFGEGVGNDSIPVEDPVLSGDQDQNDKDLINTVFIATRHDSHAGYVVKALGAGKHVFVEKPLCLTIDELESIKSSIIHHQSSILMVGFNRRYAPLTVLLKEKIGSGPMAMIYRVNAGRIPKDSWIQDKERGGGRIVGEVCHFMDYLTFLNGSLPRRVFAAALADPAGCEDTVSINLEFQNGSIGTIDYFANGAKGLFKEYVEVHRGGMSAVLRDFKELSVYGSGRPYNKKLLSQDKGQKEMVQTFVGAVRDGGLAPIPFADICAVTLATFKVLESLRTGRAVDI